MRNRIIGIAVALLLAVPFFAQEAPLAVLSQADIDRFLSDFNAIDTEMNALGDKYEDLYQTTPDDPIPVMIAKVRAVEVPAEISEIFTRHGLGTNGFEKVLVLTFAYSYYEMEKSLAQMAVEYAGDSELMAYLEEYKTQVALIKSAIHPSDLEVVEKNREALRAILSNEDQGLDSAEYNPDEY